MPLDIVGIDRRGLYTDIFGPGIRSALQPLIGPVNHVEKSHLLFHLVGDNVLGKNLSIDGDFRPTDDRHVALEDAFDLEFEFAHVVVGMPAGKGLCDGHGKAVVFDFPIPDGLCKEGAVRGADFDNPILLEE